MQAELYEYRDALEFAFEHQLTTEPLRIDVLIIKKPKELAIDKNIARIFKSNNIVEYKSPDDYLSVKDFLKVYAYAHLYAAITKDVELSDLTVTFVENRYPRELLRYLAKERGYTVEAASPGIYRICGDYIPIQVIVSRKLPESENLWLKALVKDLQTRHASAILNEKKQWHEKVPLDAYWYVVLQANPEIILEAANMAAKTRKRKRTFEEVFTESGHIPEWIARGEAKGKAEGKTEVARNLFARGMPIEEIVQVTALPLAEVHALALGN